MLGGEFRHTLDPKNRIFIPAKLREDLGEPFVIAKDIREKCLKVYSLAGWENYINPIREKNRTLYEAVFRFLHATLAQVTPDSQGRVTLPPELVEHAKIEKTAVVVGCGDYAEIWSESLYEDMKSNADISELIRQLEALGL